MLNRKDNVFDDSQITRFLEVLDQVEASGQPGVLVTIGTGSKHFSTGFDLLYWAANFENFKCSIVRFPLLMARIMEFPLPTLCIFNGNAIAGGYLLGLAHESRIMNANQGVICLSELKIGFPMPRPYMKICEAKLTPSVCAKAVYAVTYTQAEALKHGLIDDTYADEE